MKLVWIGAWLITLAVACLIADAMLLSSMARSSQMGAAVVLGTRFDFYGIQWWLKAAAGGLAIVGFALATAPQFRRGRRASGELGDWEVR